MAAVNTTQERVFTLLDHIHAHPDMRSSDTAPKDVSGTDVFSDVINEVLGDDSSLSVELREIYVDIMVPLLTVDLKDIRVERSDSMLYGYVMNWFNLRFGIVLYVTSHSHIAVFPKSPAIAECLDYLNSRVDWTIALDANKPSVPNVIPRSLCDLFFNYITSVIKLLTTQAGNTVSFEVGKDVSKHELVDIVRWFDQQDRLHRFEVSVDEGNRAMMHIEMVPLDR